MDYGSLLELVKNRRSVRRFKTDPIPDEYVEKIIEAACWAPSGFNLQPWEFVVVKKQELKDSIVQAITNYSRAHYPGIEMEISGNHRLVENQQTTVMLLPS
ncbi:Bifunctional F420 biosynthesis protein FbiB [subsurface metagenome]